MAERSLRSGHSVCSFLTTRSGDSSPLWGVIQYLKCVCPLTHPCPGVSGCGFVVNSFLQEIVRFLLSRAVPEHLCLPLPANSISGRAATSREQETDIVESPIAFVKRPRLSLEEQRPTCNPLTKPADCKVSRQTRTLEGSCGKRRRPDRRAQTHECQSTGHDPKTLETLMRSLKYHSEMRRRNREESEAMRAEAPCSTVREEQTGVAARTRHSFEKTTSACGTQTSQHLTNADSLIGAQLKILSTIPKPPGGPIAISGRCDKDPRNSTQSDLVESKQAILRRMQARRASRATLPQRSANPQQIANISADKSRTTEKSKGDGLVTTDEHFQRRCGTGNANDMKSNSSEGNSASRAREDTCRLQDRNKSREVFDERDLSRSRVESRMRIEPEASARVKVKTDDSLRDDHSSASSRFSQRVRREEQRVETSQSYFCGGTGCQFEPSSGHLAQEPGRLEGAWTNGAETLVQPRKRSLAPHNCDTNIAPLRKSTRTVPNESQTQGLDCVLNQKRQSNCGSVAHNDSACHCVAHNVRMTSHSTRDISLSNSLPKTSDWSREEGVRTVGDTPDEAREARNNDDSFVFAPRLVESSPFSKPNERRENEFDLLSTKTMFFSGGVSDSKGFPRYRVNSVKERLHGEQNPCATSKQPIMEKDSSAHNMNPSFRNQGDCEDKVHQTLAQTLAQRQSSTERTILHPTVGGEFCMEFSPLRVERSPDSNTAGEAGGQNSNDTSDERRLLCVTQPFVVATDVDNDSGSVDETRKVRENGGSQFGASRDGSTNDLCRSVDKNPTLAAPEPSVTRWEDDDRRDAESRSVDRILNQRDEDGSVGEKTSHSSRRGTEMKKGWSYKESLAYHSAIAAKAYADELNGPSEKTLHVSHTDHVVAQLDAAEAESGGQDSDSCVTKSNQVKKVAKQQVETVTALSTKESRQSGSLVESSVEKSVPTLSSKVKAKLQMTRENPEVQRTVDTCSTGSEEKPGQVKQTEAIGDDVTAADRSKSNTSDGGREAKSGTTLSAGREGEANKDPEVKTGDVVFESGSWICRRDPNTGTTDKFVFVMSHVTLVLSTNPQRHYFIHVLCCKQVFSFGRDHL